ncbi:hypothetical protein F511_05123 [Dorcoceras hygrometricum]|uniref:Uncharacterized protein n=1 Tax=Dorcoceras hygrometricum TaxID=472368 RepID=A0A2Z7C975_9LAMI|nr:hypothetical protein F511_05123 [Dorcoceras hygrometricum]
MRPDLKRSRSGSDPDSVDTPHYHWNPLEPGSGHKRDRSSDGQLTQRKTRPPKPDSPVTRIPHYTQRTRPSRPPALSQ